MLNPISSVKSGTKVASQFNKKKSTASSTQQKSPQHHVQNFDSVYLGTNYYETGNYTVH
jgi:hypothetical protein